MEDSDYISEYDYSTYTEDTDEYTDDEFSLDIDRNDTIEGREKAADIEELIEQQLKIIERIASVTELPKEAAARLLWHFKWNYDRAVEEFYADPENVLKKAGINLEVLGNSDSIYKPDGDTCEICLEPMDEERDNIALVCRHPICRKCWKEYLELKLKEHQAERITCPYYECNEVLPDMFVKEVLKDDEQLYKKYKRLQAKLFITKNPSITWCPNPGCDHAVSSSMITRGTNVQCTECGHKFCFYCKNEPHAPVSCETYKKWIIKCSDDSETLNWIQANTKPCPKCRTLIQKNKGCNHMTCSNCGYEFCWVCLGPWEPHGTNWYSCNMYKPNKDEEVIDKSKSALEKYIHYFTRYDNHAKSLRLEKELWEQVHKKMEEMQSKQNTSYIDVSFMEEALEQLSENRQVLKWSYVYAYYLKDNTLAKELFEFIQHGLEFSTEELSQVLELDISKIDKAKVINLTKIAKIKLENFFDAIDEGLPEGMVDSAKRRN